jgi:proteasome lid subunit RPN8/RPN11
MLDNNQKEQIKEWAIKNNQEETCGLIYFSGNAINIEKCKNIASDKQNYFEIDPLQYLRISNNKKNKILGIFHSQLKGEPTPIDYMVARGHNYYSIVYSIENDEFYEVDKMSIKYKEYLYRPFVMGSNDCLGLIIDFYKNEYNISITNFIRDEKWYEKNPNIIINNIEKEGFKKIDFKDIRNGDIIIFSYRHMGIYVEGDLLLHAPYNKKSVIERLTNESKRRIESVIRHNKNEK